MKTFQSWAAAVRREKSGGGVSREPTSPSARSKHKLGSDSRQMTKRAQLWSDRSKHEHKASKTLIMNTMRPQVCIKSYSEANISREIFWDILWINHPMKMLELKLHPPAFVVRGWIVEGQGSTNVPAQSHKGSVRSKNGRIGSQNFPMRSQNGPMWGGIPKWSILVKCFGIYIVPKFLICYWTALHQCIVDGEAWIWNAALCAVHYVRFDGQAE